MPDECLPIINSLSAAPSTTVVAYYHQANTYFRLGNLEQALADYNTVVELDETFARVYLNHGWVYKNLWEQGQPTYDKAVADLELASELVDNPQLQPIIQNLLSELAENK